jgi:uncharacterized protein (DUF4415 family)
MNESAKINSFLDSQPGPDIVIPKELWDAYDNENALDQISIRLPRKDIDDLKGLDGKGWQKSIRKAVHVYLDYRRTSSKTSEAQ